MNIKAFKSKTNKKERSQVESHTGESLWEVILIKIAVFDVKPYDITGLDRYGTENGIAFKYFETKLNIDTVGTRRRFGRRLRVRKRRPVGARLSTGFAHMACG